MFYPGGTRSKAVSERAEDTERVAYDLIKQVIWEVMTELLETFEQIQNRRKDNGFQDQTT